MPSNPQRATNLSGLIEHGDHVRAAVNKTLRAAHEIALESQHLIRWVHETRNYWHTEAARRRPTRRG